MRDIAKVVQGVLQAEKNYIDSKVSMLRLWVHEASRVIADRFTSREDVEKFNKFCDEILISDFECKWNDIMSECALGTSGPIFCAFFDAGVSEKVVPYEEATDFKKLKRFVEEELDNYNIEPGKIPMELVLFQDAILHITRISRVLKQPRGNCMLVGVGGSGRQSLTKLACWVTQIGIFQIEITKNYRLIEFRDDLKKLYFKTGIEGKVTVFLFSDTQLKEESFLEDINNILSSGEIPGLYGGDELPAIMDGIRPLVKAAGVVETADKMWEFFINRVRNNLHIILGMSYIGSGFRNRCRMYPSLVNCTTIDWFHEWPEEALAEVQLISNLTLLIFMLVCFLSTGCFEIFRCS
jgi:dynein heavy chain